MKTLILKGKSLKYIFLNNFPASRDFCKFNSDDKLKYILDKQGWYLQPACKRHYNITKKIFPQTLVPITETFCCRLGILASKKGLIDFNNAYPGETLVKDPVGSFS